MSMKKLHFVPLLGLLLAAGPLAAQSAYQVVVSSSNPSSSMAKADVAKLFLKKTTSWSHGLKVQPVDQVSQQAVRGSFTAAVHGKNVSSVKSYWKKLIFSGRATPPPELGSDRQVLDYVRDKPGAVGYVSAGTTLGSGVKALRIN